MSWNNNVQRKKFHAKQENQAKEFRTYGMNDEQITLIHEFDYLQFKSDRRYQMHTLPFLNGVFEDNHESGENEKSPLLEKFLDKLSVSDNDSSEHSRYWWVDEIDNPELVKSLKQLSRNDLDIITLFAFDGYTQSEIAKKLGVNQSNISHAISRIKKACDFLNKRIIFAFSLATT